MAIHNKVLKAAKAEAERLGCEVSFSGGTKHDKMTVTHDGITRVRSVPRNRGTHRPELAADWIKQDIRKIVKEIESHSSISNRLTR